MSLRDQMQAVYDEYGKLTPALVVEAARPADHPLHHRFEWDDAVAGPKFREVQASELIRRVKVKFREQDGRKPEGWVREFHAVRDEDGEHVYQPLDVVLSDPLTTRMVMRQMEHEWKALRRKYQDFEEFWRMIAEDAA